MARFGLRLTPHGHLLAEPQDDAPEIDAAVLRRLTDAFARGTGYGLVQLGAGEIGQTMPPVFVWWRAFASRYVGGLCLHASGGEDDASLPVVPPLDAGELASLVLTAPMMAGAEYLTEAVLLALWDEMALAFGEALAASGGGLQRFLNGLNPAWNLVGRVHFNLAENRRDAEQPFAFMATYTTRLSAQARAQHVPLGQALREYSGAANPRQAAVAAAAGAARRRKVRLAAADDRRRRDLSPAALGTRRGVALPAEFAGTGERRRGGAYAGHLAGQPAGTGTRHRDCRQPQALGGWAGRGAGFPAGRHSGRRTADRG